MVDYLFSVSWISLILLLGIVISALASKLKLPDVLFLLVLGMVIAGLKKFGVLTFTVPFDLLVSFAIFALVMIIFESTSHFKIKEVGRLYPYAMKLTFIFLLFCLVILTLATYLLFFFKKGTLFESLLISAIFAGLMSGTSPSSIFPILKGKVSRIVELIRIESLLNSTTSVIIPFLILGILANQSFSTSSLFFSFAQSIMTGVGTGIVIALIMAYILRKLYFPTIS
ncbi:hypothetical protein CL622_02750, partial [archaeon]|nr:hypothetical protein [archaeon]